MKVGIFTFGSRGDVQPFLALAVGLSRAGHDVFLCAPSDFADLVESHGIAFRPLSLNFKELQSRRAHKQVLTKRFTGIFRARSDLRRLGDTLNRDAWRLLADAEAIVYSSLTITAQGVAEKLGVPGIEAFYVPLEPSSQAAPVVAGIARPRSGWFNRLASEIGLAAVWRIYGSSANRLRRELALPPLPFWGPCKYFARVGQPVLYLCSPTVVPPPGDWRKDIHMVGFNYLEPSGSWQPPADLAAFLEAGPAPLVVGFGSMPNLRPAEATALLVEAVRRSGQRAVLQQGAADLGQAAGLPEQIFLASDVPHSWLFPRAMAVMHHGGAGTTAAAFRAGVPQVVVPHMLDQPFWAERAYALGVGPKPFSARKLSVDRVARSIAAVAADSSFARRAAEIGALVRGENGVGRAVELFSQYVACFPAERRRQALYQSCGS